MSGLEGRVALVTGGAQGVGEGIAECLLEDGATVIISDIKTEVGLQTAARLAEIYGEGRIAFEHQDVTDEARWPELCAQIVDRFGGLDMLVNNAASVLYNPVSTLPLAEFRRMMEIVLDSVLIGTQAALPHLRARARQWRGGASIVNIASMASEYATASLTAYHIAKKGVAVLTRCSAKEFGSDRIRVNSVHPGAIMTPLLDKMLFGERVRTGQYSDRDEAIAKVANANPLGIIGEPRDIGGAVAFLCSDRARFITGAQINVDGGWLP